MSELLHRTLSHDALIDILIFCHDDLKSVMNLASTCTTLYAAITECSERLWIYILNKKFMGSRREKKGSNKRKNRKPLVKEKTLSILENSTGLSDRSKQIISIIRTQVRFERKHQILKGYYEERDFAKYKYFSNLNIKDDYIWKLLKREMVESKAIYSPENIIKEKFGNSPIQLIYLYFNGSMYTVKEFIDAIFRKENAHLELNIHNRTISSYLYDYWKENRKSKLDFNQELSNFIRYTRICQDTNDSLLFIKLIYLEFPNVMNGSNQETAYEQEKHTKGSFKNTLLYFKNYLANVQEAVNIFAKELYGNNIDLKVYNR
ncbi:predicted protein [Naegleria gruberi]|uniref:Predicted protein n=1 Tax=Naegleria gruberi TaxID=5762 RepID=D2W1E9_NAEGR|nr:uncharacterized protein NAEGRDRAFT_75192 [Naegleria gruberi]EFC37036.1 predicted protein [Naegleria gruberi]|eukprot:XP_002669780.1 predicted protein [Naegleria gruberi strain NEG-M]